MLTLEQRSCQAVLIEDTETYHTPHKRSPHTLDVKLLMISFYLSAGYVSSSCPEALCERSHQHVNVIGTHPEVFHNSSACCSHCSNAVSFVQVEVGFVFVLQGDNLWQAHDGPFHAAQGENQGSTTNPALLPMLAENTVVHCLIPPKFFWNLNYLLTSQRKLAIRSHLQVSTKELNRFRIQTFKISKKMSLNVC